MSCPECGYPMTWGFKKVCRQGGAQLVMVPRLFHPSHVRVYVAGPRAALTALVVDGFWLVVVLTAFAALGRACAH